MSNILHLKTPETCDIPTNPTIFSTEVLALIVGGLVFAIAGAAIVSLLSRNPALRIIPVLMGGTALIAGSYKAFLSNNTWFEAWLTSGIITGVLVGLPLVLGARTKRRIIPALLLFMGVCLVLLYIHIDDAMYAAGGPWPFLRDVIVPGVSCVI